MVHPAVNLLVSRFLRRAYRHPLDTENDPVVVDTNVGTHGGLVVTPLATNQPGEASQSEADHSVERHAKFQEGYTITSIEPRPEASKVQADLPVARIEREAG